MKNNLGISINKEVLTAEKKLKFIDKEVKLFKIDKIKKKFDEAFDNLSEESKNIVVEKNLNLAIESSHGKLFKLIVNRNNGNVYGSNIQEDIICIHYLKNRFVIKETLSEMYIVAPKYAIDRHISAVGVIENIDSIDSNKKVLLCTIGEDNVAQLFLTECDNINKITQIASNIYIIQQNEVLIAVTDGISWERIMEKSKQDVLQKPEIDISYV